MSDFFSWFVSWEALALYAAGVCAAVALYVPFLRTKAMIAGALILGALGIYSKGKRDAKIAAAKRTQEAIKRGQEARARAERDVNSGSVRDPRDRDI